MSTQDEFQSGDDWTSDENSLLASLPSERIPPDELKARTMESMTQHGLLREPSSSRGRLVPMLAAACVIFIAGAAVGYVAATRASKQPDDSRVATRQAVAQADSTAPQTQPVRHIVWY